MQAPYNPRRPRKAQSPAFHESLSQTIPVAPSVQVAGRLPITFVLAILWIAAAVAAGVGIGLLFLHAQVQAPADAPFPEATQSVKVQAATLSLSTIVLAQPAQATPLLIKPATGVKQASAGSPFKVASTSYLQPAQSSASMQPGYSPDGNLQGTTGTTGVGQPQ